MLDIVYSSDFKKDYKRIKKRGYDMRLLASVVTTLCNCEKLPERFRDHNLVGKYTGYRECHITPDWLLVYTVKNSVLKLELTRTGTHSDLF
jgi:mRNA interferase YafQ